MANGSEYDSNSASGDSSSTSGVDSSTDGTGTNGSSKGNSETADAYKNSISKQESKAVFKLKIMVIFIMLMATVSVSVLVFFLTRRSETDEFETQWDGTALKVVSSFEGVIDRIGTIASIGISATVYGVDGIARWPFVSLSAFQQRSATVRSISAALYVTISPFITDQDRLQWEDYVVEKNSDWIANGFAYQEKINVNHFEAISAGTVSDSVEHNLTSKSIFFFNDLEEPVYDPGPGPYLVSWQTSPVLRTGRINENLLRNEGVSKYLKQCVDQQAAILGSFETAPAGPITSPHKKTAFFATLRSILFREEMEYLGDPVARIYLPIYDSFEENRTAIAAMVTIIHWTEYFKDLLPVTVRGINVVLDSSCDGSYTYEINGENVVPIGFGDFHDTKFDNMMRRGSFEQFNTIWDGTEFGLPLSQDGSCQYTVRVYPSQNFHNIYLTNMPIIITFAVAMVFLFTAGMFCFYDRLVEKRQQLVLAKAAQSTAIVSALFPKQVRERMFENADAAKADKNSAFIAPNHRLKKFLTGDDASAIQGMQQIADLFPYCTVLFADISGFTAWSSAREPEQIFILLQTVYQEFDNIAKRRNVFKVETIGDCYVAATGLPEPQAKHAVIMARFAWECRRKMNELTQELEVQLGPDTGELAIRIGMHSGPVTAGVLVGSNARFQLFGDTVNTAARMESNGLRDKIQITKKTADLIIAAGKEHWVKARDDDVNAKGKGNMRAFWLNPGKKKATSVASSDRASSDAGSSEDIAKQEEKMLNKEAALELKRTRQVDWMVDVMLEHIKKMVAKRRALGEKITSPTLAWEQRKNRTSLEEVTEIITLSKYDTRAAAAVIEVPEVEISEELVSNLREFISTIASLYRDNPFHNFEHACHVTMSVNKLLKRVTTPDLAEDELMEIEAKGEDLIKHLHHYTAGINTDPLVLFAVVFSALIHDVDHRGISNAQLAKEERVMALRYKQKSLAEQNSLDIAWDLILEPQFDALRRFAFGSNKEMLRFRQLLVNIVLATDIFDKDLNELRKNRWEKAFGERAAGISEDHQAGLRSAIVLEHMIQASDVSHTMQHWHIYRKWNKRLFREMHKAYKQGRMGVDPATFWYKGEIGFFDNYIIPLAKKLRECRVFGVACDEFLNYAVNNRNEWEERGEEILAELLAEANKECATGYET